MIRTTSPLALNLTLALTLAVAGCNSGAPGATGATGAAGATGAGVPGDYVEKVQAFRDKHEGDYIRDWVSIAGLHFLEPGTHSVGSAVRNDIVIVANLPEAIGRLHVKGTSITFDPAPGVTVMRKGEAVTGPIVMKEEGQALAPEVLIGDVRLVAHVDARFLYADLDPDGTTVLDFNEAYNPPCAFNPYTTCPIPVKDSILPIKVLAGEKAYPIHVTIPEPTQ